MDGMKAYLVDVIEQYLPDPSAGPQLENLAVIKTTSAECCSDCLDTKVLVESVYLFAGHLQCTSDAGESTWILDLRDCLVSVWIPNKYRKMSKWVTYSRADSKC